MRLLLKSLDVFWNILCTNVSYNHCALVLTITLCTVSVFVVVNVRTALWIPSLAQLDHGLYCSSLEGLNCCLFFQ